MAFSQYVVTWSNVAVCYSSELYILTLSMPGDNLRNTFLFLYHFKKSSVLE